MNKKIEEIYKELSPEEHVLQKSGMYLGSTKRQKSDMWLFDDGKMCLKEIEYIPAFLKLFDEIISNSVDESKRSGSKLDTIKVSIKDNYISVWDNGGIPCVIHKEKNQYVAEMVFSSLRTGSNFNDNDNRIVVGTNGLGSVLVNLFSKEFIVSSCDGKNNFFQIYKNNMTYKSKPKISESKRNHTEIKFLVDFERFNMVDIDDIHYSLIYKRVLDLAGINPNIKFFFNDEKITISTFEDYIKLYCDDYLIDKTKHRWKLAVAPSNIGYRQISFANGASTTDGGSHVDYILNQIIVQLKAFFLKKHKVDIRPSDIKNHLMIFVDSEVINPSFNSQTKEKLITEVKDFGTEYEVSDRLVQSIIKSEIVNSVLDWIEQKKNAEENKLARSLDKKLSKIKVDKLIDCSSNKRDTCSLFIMEGMSALGDFRRYRDPSTQAAYTLRGKFINTSGISEKKIMENEEAKGLLASIGLSLINKDLSNLRYGKIIISTDMDFDGDSICGLLLNFFSIWPELFEKKIIYRAITPLLVAKNKKEKIFFYSFEEFEEWKLNNKGNYEIDYKKGLGSLETEEFEDLIKNTRLVSFCDDIEALTLINCWFNNELSDKRKEVILNDYE